MKSPLASRLGLGVLTYRFFFHPFGLVRQSIRQGGPWQQALDRSGHAAMRDAASRLPRLTEPPSGPFAEVAFLSGPKYWHQTLFCIVSLQLNMHFRITPVVYDDGGMSSEIKDEMIKIVPWIRFKDEADTSSRLDELLPSFRYPTLRKRRLEYPHLRKLIDIHVGSTEFRLVSDSDMLFFDRPYELEAWFAKPDWLYMLDVQTAYGYPLSVLSEMAGAAVPERVNVGLYAVDGAAIDWDRVEHWCSRQLNEYGPQYVQEQALTAQLFAGRQATVLPRERYVVMPDQAEGERRSAVLHHYVDISKRAYFRDNWRVIATLAEAASKT